MARISRLIKKGGIISLENVVGILIAILIIFNLKLEIPLHNALNTTAGMVCSVVIVVILFATMNPIIGILFLIYLYQNINMGSVAEKKKDTILQQLNPPNEIQVEEIIILERAPIKNQNQNNNVSFKGI